MLAFQQMLERCPNPEARKGFIMDAHCHGAIDAGECELLIQANLLETA
jgi:hypothetical protein